MPENQLGAGEVRDRAGLPKWDHHWASAAAAAGRSLKCRRRPAAPLSPLARGLACLNLHCFAVSWKRPRPSEASKSRFKHGGRRVWGALASVNYRNGAPAWWYARERASRGHFSLPPPSAALAAGAAPAATPEVVRVLDALLAEAQASVRPPTEDERRDAAEEAEAAGEGPPAGLTHAMQVRQAAEGLLIVAERLNSPEVRRRAGEHWAALAGHLDARLTQALYASLDEDDDWGGNDHSILWSRVRSGSAQLCAACTPSAALLCAASFAPCDAVPCQLHTCSAFGEQCLATCIPCVQVQGQPSTQALKVASSFGSAGLLGQVGGMEMLAAFLGGMGGQVGCRGSAGRVGCAEAASGSCRCGASGV